VFYLFGFLRRKAQFQQQQYFKEKKETDGPKPGLVSDMETNIKQIQDLMDSPNDLIVRRLSFGNKGLCLIYFDGLADKETINHYIIRTIQSELKDAEIDQHSTEKLLEKFENEIVAIPEVKVTNTLDDVSLAILSGDTALMIDSEEKVLLIGTKGWESRSISEPVTEALVRGPRDGFTENIQTNIVHLRRRIKDPNLHFESFKVGRRSKKDLIISYVAGIVHPNIVKEIRRRIQSIDIDDVLESGYVEQWIEDDFLSPFPQIQNTERPDKVAAAILQGKVAIFLDGTPFVLLAPITFAETLQSPEDYYERWYIGSLIRGLRYLCAFIALFLPSLYVALVSFHPGMIPSKLAFSISSTRDGVPFPSLIEALFMEITMEILREAGIRLPKPIGQTVGIVGGLVIGEAAVSAGIVSPIMVIVVAVTAISTFAIPFYSFAITIRMLRFFFLIVAGFFGFYGIILAYIMINIHMANLKSVGVPYTTPFAPTFYSDWKDLVFRAPLTFFQKRPHYLEPEDESRMKKEEGQ